MKRIYYSLLFTTRFSFLFFTVLLLAATASAQPYTAFDHVGDFPSGGSGGAAANAGPDMPGGIETGVKFRLSQPGNINGVWFYRGTSNTGTHTAQLWNASGGAALKSASLAGGASGWLFIPFATPYHANAGTIYIASVYMPTGFYAVTGGYFSGNLVNDGIELLCNCESANGVFDYTSAPLTTIPTSTFGGGNYWIDISFSPDFPLPVTLSDFKALTRSSDIDVSWKTDHEFNNKGFEVQRSNNGSDWYAISFVAGAGESSIARNYSYTDKGLAPGTYYYRLKQMDLDGKSSFTPIVTASIVGKGQVSLFQNYPNPFVTSTSIRFDLPRAQHARLTLFDMSGREVKVLTDNTREAGSHIITLDAGNLKKQTYIVQLQTENTTLTKKIVLR